MALRHARAARRGGLLPSAVGVALTFTVALDLAAACSDRSGVLQPPTPTSGDWTAFLSEWSVLGGPADNYNCDRAIAAVTWWGFLDDLGGDFNPKSFRLTFFSADGDLSLPGAIEHVYDVVVAPRATGELYDEAPLYAFHATLDPPCPLRRGWLVIEGSALNPSRPFSWITGESGDRVSAVRAWWGLWYWVGNIDLALALAPAACAADVNGDGIVNVPDLLEVLGAWDLAGVPQDVNGDGIVNVLDVLEVLAAWGPCP